MTAGTRVGPDADIEGTAGRACTIGGGSIRDTDSPRDGGIGRREEAGRGIAAVLAVEAVAGT